MTAHASSSASSAAAADTVLMDRALELAARGVALASPNPMVGAVVVRDGRIVGEGFHTYDGVRHAEVIALEAAGESARGATVYVNLEPCCHTGRTGPCTQALIAAGVSRVMAAMEDPNRKVAGRGFQQLRAAGIDVSVGLREDQARRLNEAFSRWIVSRKPLVILKSAVTLDGQLVLPIAKSRARKSARVSRHDRWISSPESRAEVQRMRHACDALLTGIGTVLADDPLLTDRTGLARRSNLLRVVLDSRLRLPLHSRLVRSADNDLLVFTRASENSPKARALRRAGVDVVRLGSRGSKATLVEVVKELGRRDILSVLLEAGTILNSAALDAEIVDKIRVFFAPRLAGIAEIASAAPLRMTATLEKSESRAESFHIELPRKLKHVTTAQFGPDFAVEGYLRNVYGTR